MVTDAFGDYSSEAAFAAARREMERDMAWAEHVRDALLIIEEDDDE